MSEMRPIPRLLSDYRDFVVVNGWKEEKVLLTHKNEERAAADYLENLENVYFRMVEIIPII